MNSDSQIVTQTLDLNFSDVKRIIRMIREPAHGTTNGSPMLLTHSDRESKGQSHHRWGRGPSA